MSETLKPCVRALAEVRKVIVMADLRTLRKATEALMRTLAELERQRLARGKVE